MNEIVNEKDESSYTTENIEDLILVFLENTHPSELIKRIQNNEIQIPSRTKEELKNKVVRILKESKNTLSQNSIQAIICLEDINEKNTALMNLIKKKKIEAMYAGELDKPINIDMFFFRCVK